MNDSRLYLKLFFLFFLGFIATLIAFDIKSHQTFSKSSINHFFQQSGVLNLYKQNEKFFQKWSKKAIFLFDEHFQIVWNQIVLLFKLIWKLLLPIRNWINLNVPKHLEKFEKDYWPSILQTLRWLLNFITDNLLILRQSINKLVFRVGIWFQQNVLVGPIAPEKLQLSMINLIEAGQHYIVQTYAWAHDQFKILLS